MKLSTLFAAALAVALPHSAIAQDLSQYDQFFFEEIEGPYSNNWYVRHVKQEGLYHYFSVIADGKMPYEGTFITACRTDMEDRIVPAEGFEFSDPSDEVVNAFYFWVCTS